MIIEATYNHWNYQAKKKINRNNECIDFFAKNGKIIRDENSESKNDSGEELFTDIFEARFIGPINDVPIEILNNKNVEISFFKGMSAMTDRLISRSPAILEELSRDKIVNIHMPSNELFGITNVTWLEDACTQLLQEKLDEGLRIVACIPRPGQRRPDYILGR